MKNLKMALVVVIGLSQAIAFGADYGGEQVEIVLTAKGNISLSEDGKYLNTYSFQKGALNCKRSISFNFPKEKDITDQLRVPTFILQGSQIRIPGVKIVNYVSSGGPAIYSYLTTSLSGEDEVGNKFSIACGKNVISSFASIWMGEVIDDILPSEFSLKIIPKKAP